MQVQTHIYHAEAVSLENSDKGSVTAILKRLKGTHLLSHRPDRELAVHGRAEGHAGSPPATEEPVSLGDTGGPGEGTLISCLGFQKSLRR